MQRPQKANSLGVERRQICALNLSQVNNFVYVSVMISGRRQNVLSLIDSGSSISLISNDLCKQMGLTPKFTNDIRAISVQGAELPIFGYVHLPIEIEGVSTTCPCYVVDGINYRILFGIDMLQSHEAVIDCQQSVVVWRKLSVVSKLRCRCDPFVIVRSVAAVSIPAGSEMFVSVHVPARFRTVDYFMVEPLPSQTARLGMFVAKAVVSSDGETTVCKVLNLMDRPLKLRRRQALAIASNAEVVKHVNYDDVASVSAYPAAELQAAKPFIPQFTSIQEKCEFLQREGFKLEREDMTDNQFERLCDLLIEYIDCFREQSKPVRMEPYEVQLIPGVRIPTPRIHRHSPPVRKIVREQLQQWLKDGTIEEGPSEYKFPIVVVRKPCGCGVKFKQKGRTKTEFRLKTCNHPPTYRSCLDLRACNIAVQNVSFVVPTLADIVQDLNGSNYFSRLDVATAFQQVNIGPRTRQLLGIQSDDFDVRCAKLPFGLRTSGGVFQSLQAKILRNYNHLIASAYVDDCVCYSQTIDDMLVNLRKLLERYRYYRLRLRADKCMWIRRELPFLGVILNGKGYYPDPAKVELIRQLPAPRTAAELRSFLACIGFFRKFVPGYAFRVSSFRPLLSRQAVFQWTQEHQAAYDELRAVLASDKVMLHYPQFDQPFHFFIDSSAGAYGYIIAQKCPETGAYRAILYGSRLWPKGQQNLASSYHELLAVCASLEANRQYTNGRTIVHTDSISTAFLNGLKKQTGPLFRYSLRLQAFDLKFVHTRGAVHPTDFLSRVTPETGIALSTDEDQFDPGLDERVICAVGSVRATPEQTKTLAQHGSPRATWCEAVSVSQLNPHAAAFQPLNGIQKTSVPVQPNQVMHSFGKDGSKQQTLIRSEANADAFPLTAAAVSTRRRSRHLSDPGDIFNHPAMVHGAPSSEQSLPLTSQSASSTDTAVQSPTSPVQQAAPLAVEGRTKSIVQHPLSVATRYKPADKSDVINSSNAPPAAKQPERAPSSEERPRLFRDRRDQLLLQDANRRLTSLLQRLTRAQWRQEQRRCVECAPMIAYLTDGFLPVQLVAARKIAFEAVHYTVASDGLLYHIPRASKQQQPLEAGQLVIPHCFRAEILRLFHDDSGHVRASKSYMALKKYVYWPRLYSDLMNHLANCVQCARVSQAVPPHISLQHRPIEAFMSDIYIDNVFLGPSQNSLTGQTYTHALVISERLSNFMLFIPVPNLSAKANLYAFQMWLSIFGTPKRVHADNSTTFSNDLWHTFMGEQNIKLCFAASQRHSTMGSAEKSIARGVSYIRRLTDPSAWSDHIMELNMTLNSELSTVSGFSSYQIAFGCESPFHKNRVDSIFPTSTLTSNLLERWDSIHDSRLSAHKSLTDAFNKMDKQYSKRVKRANNTVFQIGTKVLVYDESVPVHAVVKFHRFYREAMIVEKLEHQKYKIQMCDTQRESIVHIDRIKLHPQQDTPVAQDDAAKQKSRKQVRFNDDVTVHEPPLNTQWFEIQRIIAHRYRGRKLEFKVLWKGFLPDEPQATSWVGSRDVTAYAKRQYFARKSC